MYCDQCGMANRDQARFCRSCGELLYEEVFHSSTLEVKDRFLRSQESDNSDLTLEQRAVWRWTAKVFDQKFVVLDTETTGVGPDAEVIDVAIVDATDELLYQAYIKPQGQIPVEATAVHGLRESDLASSPSFPEIWPKVQSILEGMLVVGYNVEFDLRVLKQSAKRYNIVLPDYPSACLMSAYSRFRGTSNRPVSLTMACEELGIDPGDHSASEDASATFQLLQHIFFLRDEFDDDEYNHFASLPIPHWVPAHDLNTVQIAGRVGTYTDVRYMNNGTEILTMAVLIPDEEDRTVFAVPVAVLGDISAKLGEVLQKNDPIFVSGSLRSWPSTTPDGVVRSVNYWIVAETISHGTVHFTCEDFTRILDLWPPR